jgi:hypothetical protein
VTWKFATYSTEYFILLKEMCIWLSKTKKLQDHEVVGSPKKALTLIHSEHPNSHSEN